MDHDSGATARTTGPALEAHYRFILWLVPALERFPRSQKFLLGDRIQGVALDVLDALIEATYTRQRSGHLARANLGVEKLRFLVRLAVVTRGVSSATRERRTRSRVAGRTLPESRVRPTALLGPSSLPEAHVRGTGRA